MENTFQQHRQNISCNLPLNVNNVPFTTTKETVDFVVDSDANFTLPPIVKSCHTGNGKPTTERFDCSDKITLSGHPVWGVISSFLHDDR